MSNLRAAQAILLDKLEEINDELASLQFDIDHKYHSAMELFDLLSHMDNLKLEKAKLEAKLKAI